MWVQSWFWWKYSVYHSTGNVFFHYVQYSMCICSRNDLMFYIKPARQGMARHHHKKNSPHFPITLPTLSNLPVHCTWGNQTWWSFGFQVGSSGRHVEGWLHHLADGHQFTQNSARCGAQAKWEGRCHKSTQAWWSWCVFFGGGGRVATFGALAEWHPFKVYQDVLACRYIFKFHRIHINLWTYCGLNFFRDGFGFLPGTCGMLAILVSQKCNTCQLAPCRKFSIFWSIAVLLGSFRCKLSLKEAPPKMGGLPKPLPRVPRCPFLLADWKAKSVIGSTSGGAMEDHHSFRFCVRNVIVWLWVTLRSTCSIYILDNDTGYGKFQNGIYILTLYWHFSNWSITVMTSPASHALKTAIFPQTVW